jgi:mono/diheme cytochrome c family protein
MRLLLFWAAALLAIGARAEDGLALFTQNCVLCHQSGGTGLEGQFPRLAGRVSLISLRSEGRAYLIDVLSFGMSGNIRVDDQDILGVMPSFAALSDEAVASILNYAQSLGERPGKVPAPFTAKEIAGGRAKAAKSPDEVLGERQHLRIEKALP